MSRDASLRFLIVVLIFEILPKICQKITRPTAATTPPPQKKKKNFILFLVIFQYGFFIFCRIKATDPIPKHQNSIFYILEVILVKQFGGTPKMGVGWAVKVRVKGVDGCHHAPTHIFSRHFSMVLWSWVFKSFFELFWVMDAPAGGVHYDWNNVPTYPLWDDKG